MEPTTAVMTQQQEDTLAERIAAVLRERKKVGAQRRLRELEMQLRNTQRATERYHATRPESAKMASVAPALREHCDQRMQTVEAAYQAVTSSNAALEVLGA